MKAAVLHALGAIPRFEDFPDPQPGQEEVLVHVTAASLKNIDKTLAARLSHTLNPRLSRESFGAHGPN